MCWRLALPVFARCRASCCARALEAPPWARARSLRYFHAHTLVAGHPLGFHGEPGAMLGGLIIGMIESFWSAYLSPEYKDVATFAILILVLMFRPSGLLGRPEIEKV